MNRTKEAIKQELKEELFWDYRVDSSDVKVEVKDSEVELTGTVPSFTAWNAAATAAWNIEGVSTVNNQLQVEFPPALEVPADDEIITNVRDTLAWNPEVYDLDITVHVNHGLVTLEGTVDAYWKSWKAEDLVSNLRGVTGVENHLAVVPTDSFLDKDIARDIESALERNQYVDAEQVTVLVKNGRVTLTGTVPTFYARGRAFDAAAFTPGVISVDNNTVVG